MSATPLSYEQLSLNALLAIALLGVEEWCAQVDLVDPQLKDLIEHLWEWPTIGPDTFDVWERWSSPVLEFALGGEPPREMVDLWKEAGLDLDQARPVLAALVELVYSHLFAAIDRSCQRSMCSARGRTAELPAGGHRNCPVVANRTARG